MDTSDILYCYLPVYCVCIATTDLDIDAFALPYCALFTSCSNIITVDICTEMDNAFKSAAVY